jgi:hypothetical protein
MSILTNNREIFYFMTAVLAEPSDQCWPFRLEFLEFFSLQNTLQHTRLAKKFSRSILRFLTNLEARYIQFEKLI